MKHFIQTLHKYIRRIGTPGSYEYFYRDPNTKVKCPKCNKPTRSAEIIWYNKKPDMCFSCYGKIKDRYFPPERKRKQQWVPLKDRRGDDEKARVKAFYERQKAKLKEAGFDDWPDSDVKPKSDKDAIVAGNKFLEQQRKKYNPSLGG